MTIDNFEKVKEILDFESDVEYFYMIEILKRKKDKGNEHVNKNSKIIDYFYIYSSDDLDKYKFIIQEKCKSNNARAYIRITRRDLKKVGFAVAQRTLEYLSKEQYRPIQKVYPKVCGSMPDKKKKWLIDLDDLEHKNAVVEYLKKSNISFTEISTVSGIHYITDPFNLHEYGNFFEKLDITIHKDNSTLLFFNGTC